MATLFQRIAPAWGHDPEPLAIADTLPDADIRVAHDAGKADLVAEVRARTGFELRPDLPVIAFARRMTDYKRSDLIFTELERLRVIHATRPFQLVMAGKAHPKDEGGRR